MLSMETKTKLKPEEVIKRAVDFFGPGGYKMAVKRESPDCVFFEGGGGGVEVTTCTEGKRTTVEFVSREWDNQVKEFMSTLN